MLARVRRSGATNKLETFAGNDLQNEWHHFAFIGTIVGLKALFEFEGEGGGGVKELWGSE